jgi:protein TonB
VGNGVREPRKLRHVSPVYPDVARQARVQGVVILELTISPEGRVSDARILRGIPLLDQAALDAVRQWVYTPTLVQGTPVPVLMTVTVNFRLQ